MTLIMTEFCILSYLKRAYMIPRPGSAGKYIAIVSILAIIFGFFSWYLFLREPGGSSAGLAVLPDSVDYNYHIRPILSDRCFKCHGPDAAKREASLRLDTEEGAYAALKDEPSQHVIVPGDPLRSVLFQRISSTDTSYLMPPPSQNLPLTEFEVKLIEKWIRQGAKYKPHWAFIPPSRPELPVVSRKDWPNNEIDHFVLAAMESRGFRPNEEADRERLLKRLSFDLTGLPPTLEMQQRFVGDQNSDAYEKMVDELLASPHYGEKMAVPWLDIARYADSHGYQDDGLRTMWPWRDWVIHAFNRNYSYQKFVQWQLAGDLMPDPGLEQLLATGFNRNHKITQEGGVIPEEYRIEYVTDRTNTFGKAFLALTFECSKCHDHKYDPLSQQDYFATFAFFNQVDEKGFYGDISLESLADPPSLTLTTRQIDSVLRFINKKDTAAVTVMIMKDTAAVRTTHILKRGAYDQPAGAVNFGTPASVLSFDSIKYLNNRLGLAQWLFSEKNPLTARVFVNRIWQQFFGRGIVKTSGDFGMQGELPTHPALLDWLAVDFSGNGWDIKRLVKQIVMSATYRQSAEVTEKKLTEDPENIWLSRYSRKRLSAEEQRDLVLASGGLLVREIGGPSVKPYQPKGIWEASTSGRGQLRTYKQDHGDSLYRRTIYTFIKRTVPPPSLLVFDASNRDQCEVSRTATATPLQALVMLNDPQVLEACRVMAEKHALKIGTDEEKIGAIFRSIVCRKPVSREMDMLKEFLDKERERFNKEPSRAERFIKTGEYPLNAKASKTETAALMQLIHTIFNLDESGNKY